MKTATLALLTAANLLLACPAFAESNAVLAPAEHAYQDVDFPNTHELAEQALHAGGATRQQSARLYVLLGMSSAALGDTLEAKQDFTAALAIDPALRLEKSLSPKIRDPYLEAQGYWSAAAERLALSAKPSSDAAHLIVRVVDPAGLVAKTELRIRATRAAGRTGTAGATDEATVSFQAAPVTRFALPTALQRHDYEFALMALDRYGNVLAEYGVDADPILVRAPSPARQQSQLLPAVRGRSYALPVVLGAVGLGAVAAGVIFHLERQREAKSWNSPSCEQPGQTRLAQCQGVDSRLHREQSLAIGLYSGGGALLVGSVIALVSGRPEQVERAAREQSAFSCVLSGTALSCAGHF